VAATRNRQVAPERLLQTRSTFTKSVLCPWVCPSWDEWSGIDLFIDAGVKINWRIQPWGASDSKVTACHAWDLWRLLYLPARQCSCSPSAWDNQPSGTRHLRSFYQTFLPPTSTDLNPIGYKNIGENAAAGLASSWRRWTEAAVDRCLASFQVKIHRWRSWWVA